MEWSTRLELESTAHQASCFATLTYSNENLSYSVQCRRPTLIRSDLSSWLKRFRERYHRENENSSKLRFFGVGEYGDALSRPHYHVILFGYPGCTYGRSRYDDGRTIDCCYFCDLVRDSWGKGIVQAEPLAAGHIRYTAGYVLKKMTSKHDVRLEGRQPEFAAMSLQNGGIGINAVPELARRSQKQNYDVISTVPLASGKNGRIGRYLKSKVRMHLGSPDGKAPDYVQKDAEAAMLPLLRAARQDKEVNTLKKQIQAKSKGKIDSLKARDEMFNTRRRNRTL